MRPTDCGRNQTINYPNVIDDKFTPAVVPGSRLVRGLAQMFLDQYPFFIGKKQGSANLNPQRIVSNREPLHVSSLSGEHETPHTRVRESTTGLDRRPLPSRN